MYPEPIDEYHAPADLRSALDLLARLGDSAKVLAGGQSLMQQMKARLVAPRALVDLNRVAGLGEMTERGNALDIGALVRLHLAAEDARLRERFTALAEAAAAIGDRQVRNRGTLVGSIAFAANYGDVAPAAVALGASVVVAAAPDGRTREQPVEEFVKGAGAVDLRGDEIVTALRVPMPAPGSGSAYVKHGRVYQDRATLGVAAWVRAGAGGAPAEVRIVVGGLARPVERAVEAEAALRGAAGDAGLEAAGAAAADSLRTQSDELASAEYRTQLLRTLVPRAVATALGRAGR